MILYRGHTGEVELAARDGEGGYQWLAEERRERGKGAQDNGGEIMKERLREGWES